MYINKEIVRAAVVTAKNTLQTERAYSQQRGTLVQDVTAAEIESVVITCGAAYIKIGELRTMIKECM